MKDVFDRVLEKKRSEIDYFKAVLEKKKSRKPDIFDKAEKEVTPLIQAYVKAHVPKPAATLTVSDVESIVKEKLSKIKPPEKIVEKVIQKEIIKTEPKVEIKKVVDDEFKKELSKLKKEIESLWDSLPVFTGGGSGVIGLPGLDNNSGQLLMNDGGKPVWYKGTVLPIGDQGTDGSWRLFIDGENLVIQRRESGEWADKGTYMANENLTSAMAYDVNGNLIYLGTAEPGAATSDSAWRIKKMTYNASNQITNVQWPSASTLFSFVWDNRATYTYS